MISVGRKLEEIDVELGSLTNRGLAQHNQTTVDDSYLN